MKCGSSRLQALCTAPACLLIAAAQDGPVSVSAEWGIREAPRSCTRWQDDVDRCDRVKPAWPDLDDRSVLVPVPGAFIGPPDGHGPFGGMPTAQDVPADPVPPMALRGRHAVRIHVGALDWSVDSASSGGGLTTESGSSGFVGSIAYDHFVRQDLAVGIAVGVLDSGTSTSVGIGGTTSESSTVIPILVGVTYYPEALAIGPNLRPYVSGSAGPYLGSATNSQVGPTVATESITEVAPGLRVAGGIDWFLGRNVEIGIGLGYHLVGDFDERIGSTDNYSGLELSIGLGFRFGEAP